MHRFFASSLLAAGFDDEMQPFQPEGAYDPVEQLWVSDGTTVACSFEGFFCNDTTEPCCPHLVCRLSHCHAF